jgi:hypothetical protein
MKILRLAFAGVPALALLAAIQCSVGAATTASLSPTKQSCFNGDEKATHHIWLPRGTLSNWDTRPTDQIAGPSEGRQLSFKDRVAYQRAIEDVYWRHRIWPTERPDPKPPLDAVMSQGAIEQKVQDYLRDSELLQAEWQEPITAER